MTNNTEYRLNESALGSETSLKLDGPPIEDVTRVARHHGLEPSSVPTEFSGGENSYGFKVETSDGKYVVRATSKDLSVPWRRGSKSLEHRATKYLTEDCDIGVQVPNFVPNEDGATITNYNGRTFEVYKLIEGDVKPIDYFTNSEGRRQLANLAARLHKGLEGMAVEHNEVKYDPLWVGAELGSLKGLKPKDNSDRLVVDNLKKVRAAYEVGLAAYRALEGSNVPVHADFGPHNILYQGEKPSGVIDFSEAKVGSPALDLFRIPMDSIQDMGEVVREYRTIRDLSDEDVQLILPTKLLWKAAKYAWAAKGLQKNPEKREQFLEGTVKEIDDALRLYAEATLAYGNASGTNAA